MIIPILLLTSLGIVVIYSSSPLLAIQQTIFVIVGAAFYLFLRWFDYRGLLPLQKHFYITVLFLLVIVFFIGIETRGVLRWIPLGPFTFQPSEFAKPILIVSLADFWAKNTPSWRNISKSLLITLPISLLIFRQPDLGTAIALIFIWLTMLVASNISFAKLVTISLLGGALAPIGWFLLRSYQRERFLSFLSPSQDPQGVGYNVIQSTIAVGSGEIFGRGLGHGTQSRLRFLPEFRTDFIFASIAEELGLVGSLIVLGLYAAIFFFMIKILRKTSDRAGELIVIGVASMLFVQVIINIGMNAGILPITGITLPLLSYGGSSVISTLIALGLVDSVGRASSSRTEDRSISIFS